jgi:hypothetical protein
MQLPIKCPACGDNMLTSYKGSVSFFKGCKRYLDHRIEFQANTETNRVVKLEIWISKVKSVARWEWYVSNNLLAMYYGDTGATRIIDLPFFEPDLSDYPGLIDKVKMLLTFS